MSQVVYTIGHSTRTLEQFVEMLEGFQVDTLVDVRTVPRSRTNPHYNLDTLPGQLAGYGLRHERILALGGLRKKSRTIPEQTNGFWDNRSLHNYADYALSEAFEEGLQRLLALSENHCCAIMCAEAVWWRCHRRIIADYLLVWRRRHSHHGPEQVEQSGVESRRTGTGAETDVSRAGVAQVRQARRHDVRVAASVRTTIQMPSPDAARPAAICHDSGSSNMAQAHSIVMGGLR